MKDDEFRRVERRAFTTTVDTGLWDLFLASFVSLFALAPLLSGALGDFWSSAVFVPVWGALYLALRVVRERFVVPRVGEVRFGPRRRKRLQGLSWMLLALNVVALVLGLVAFWYAETGPGASWAFPTTFSVFVLVGFSVAGYSLEIPRLFAYGLLLAGAPAVGEVLFQGGYAPHHGFPVVFGIAAATIAVIGLVKLVRLIRYESPGVGSLSNDGDLANDGGLANGEAR